MSCDYFNLDRSSNFSKNKKILNYENLSNCNNSQISSKNSSLKKAIFKQTNYKSHSIFHKIEKNNSQDKMKEDYRVIGNKNLFSCKSSSNSISIMKSNSEKLIIYDLIQDNIHLKAYE